MHRDAAQDKPEICKELCRILPKQVKVVEDRGCMAFCTKGPCRLLSRAAASSAIPRRISTVISEAACTEMK